MSRDYDVIIIGAGASGLMSACLLACSKLSVLILEKSDRVGKKLSATGNGRCNMTNLDMDWKKYYADRDWISQVIERVTPQRVIGEFERLGVLTREKDGYVYPHTNQAGTVIGALYKGIRQKNITLRLSERVTEVLTNTDLEEGVLVEGGAADGSFAGGRDSASGYRFTVCTDTDSYRSRYLVLAAGGEAGSEQGGSRDGYELAKSLGHTVDHIYPGLTGMNAAGRFWKEVAGTRIMGRFSLFVDGICQGSEEGEIQITKTGVSGIPVFQLCRMAAVGLESGAPVWGEIDFVPKLGMDECTEWISQNGFEGLVPIKWIPVIGRGQKDNRVIARTLKKFEFTITDTYGIEKAQVSAGGVPTDQIDPVSFRSTLVDGLYILGELCDADGLCGGYNLHLAWASGILSAEDLLSE